MSNNNNEQRPVEQTGIERIEPMYIHPDFESRIMHISAQKIFRVEIGAGRHYRNEQGGTYKSITTFLDAVMPANKLLQSWRESKIQDLGSVDAASEFVKATADFGTILHISVADFCRNNGVNWQQFNDFAVMQLVAMGLSGHTLQSALEELTKDFASIVKFFFDYEAKVIAVELPVFSSHGFATLIDLVVEINDKCYTEKTPKEKRNRIVAAGNLKSGKKGFYESHILQLAGERMCFNETYSKSIGFEIKEVFNIAPTDWRKAPDYKYKNRTAALDESTLMQQFNMFIEVGKARGVLGKPTKTFTVFEGNTVYGADPTEQMVTMSYDEYAVQRIINSKTLLFSNDNIINL